MDFTLLATTAVNLITPFAKSEGEDLVKIVGGIIQAPKMTNDAHGADSWF